MARQCAECQAALPAEEPGAGRAECPFCGAPLETLAPLDAGVPATADTLEAAGLPPLPPDAKLRLVDVTRDGFSVLLPPSRLGCLILAGALFAGPAIWVLVAKPGPGQRNPKPTPLPLALGVLSMGLGMMAFGVKSHFERVRIDASRTRLAIEQRVWTWRRREEHDFGPDSNAGLEVAYTQNYQPVFRVVVAGGASKKLGFGAELSVEEKNWLVDQLNRLIAAPARPAAAAALEQVRTEETLPELNPAEALERLRAKGVGVAEEDDGGLRFDVSAGLLPWSQRGIVVALFGGFAVAWYWGLWSFAANALRMPGLMGWFFTLFLIPFLGAGLMPLGVALMVAFGRGSTRIGPEQVESFLGIGPFGWRWRMPTAQVEAVALEGGATAAEANPRRLDLPAAAQASKLGVELRGGGRKQKLPVSFDNESARWAAVLVRERLQRFGCPV